MDRERCKSIVGGIQGNGAAGGMGRRETAVDESRRRRQTGFVNGVLFLVITLFGSLSVHDRCCARLR